MKKEIEISEQIDRYLLGEMTKEEKQAFEQKINQDGDLKNLIEKHNQIKQLLLDKELINVKKQLLRIYEKSQYFSFLKKFLIYPSLIILTGLLILFVSKSKTEEVTVPINIDTTVMRQEPNIHDSLKADEINSTKKSFVKETHTKKENKVEENKIHCSKPDSLGKRTDNSSLEQPIPSVESIKSMTPIKQGEREVIYNESDTPINKEPKNPCQNLNIDAKLNIEESCNDKASGSISVITTSINGGEEPYQFSINKKDSFDPSGVFRNLKSGFYEFFIKDKNGCIVSIGKFMVGTKNCMLEVIFAPEMNETWEVPTIDERDCTLKIYNREGILVLKRVLYAFETYHWEGKDMEGNPLPLGVYNFTIENMNSVVRYGNVTLVR